MVYLSAAVSLKILIGGKITIMNFEEKLTIYDLKRKLSGWQKFSSGIMARCPAHDDGTSSLSIKDAGDKILIFCHAGCKFEDICAALMIKPEQLFSKKCFENNFHKDKASENKKYIHYDYKNEAGELKFQCVRIETVNNEGKKSKTFRHRQPDGKGEWLWNISNPPVEKIPYRLPELLNSAPDESVFIAEGEKDVDSLLDIGVIATCNPLGAGKWESGYNKFFHNRRCIILPDNDEPGKSHSAKIAESLLDTVAELKILNLPDLAEKADITDWINAGGTREALLSLVEQTPVFTGNVITADSSSNNAFSKEEGRKPENQKLTSARKLLLLVQDVELFYTSDNTAYATVLINANKENIPVKSEEFGDWLNSRYFESEDDIAPSNAIKEVKDVLSGTAKLKGKLEDIFIRVAEFDGVIYLDLADKARHAVAIKESGWEIVKNAPVKFIRPDGMVPLQIPERGGSINELKLFLNINNDDFVLIASWLVACLRLNQPHPALIFQGEQGTAKSTAAKVIRRIIDPNMAPLRSLPKDERDLMIAAENSAVLCFDNVSFLKSELSDSLCRIITGSGYATRKLYTDRSETIFSLIRPIMINGIGDLINRSDLLDRSIIINLKPLPKRKAEREFWNEFDALLPKILGALLDATSFALANLNLTVNEFKNDNVELPRMADFTLWASAAEPSFGFSSGEFIDCYRKNRRAVNDAVVDLDMVAGLISRFVEKNVEWKGLPAQLYEDLKSFADDSLVHSRDFPKDPRSLGGRLARIAPNLRARGIEYFPPDRSLRTENRVIVLKLTEPPIDNENL